MEGYFEALIVGVAVVAAALGYFIGKRRGGHSSNGDGSGTAPGIPPRIPPFHPKLPDDKQIK